MRTISISNSELKYEFKFDPLITRQLEVFKHNDFPDWTKLDFYKCQVCPFNCDEVKQCPAAADIVCVLERFSHFSSAEKLDIRYIAEDLDIKKNVDAQTALSAIIGSLIFTSACPILNANHFILKYIPPFTTDDQLSYHLLAAALIKNFFRQEKKKHHVPFDLEQFKLDYYFLEDVFRNLLNRVREASSNDANLNAVVRLTNLNMLSNLKMDAFIDKFRYLINHS